MLASTRFTLTFAKARFHIFQNHTMAGIYIHVPYCQTRCIYCDFFTQTNMKEKSPYISAVCKELALRTQYIDSETIDTIYFGGGTPSQLSEDDFKLIFEAISSNYTISDNVEITIEANPDDLKSNYIETLRRLPFNRISIGTQSFNDEELRFLNRRHSAEDAKNAVKKCQELGFSNISIDLMYGLPKQTLDIWERNLEEALSLGVQHISSYHLIYEEGTKLFRLLEQGKVKTVEEETSTEMFAMMVDKLKQGGFEHYEISNFAQQGYISRHNSSYWVGKKYLGVGPSAHSFDGNDRAFNIYSISKYIKKLELNELPIEVEVLKEETKYNDYVLTRMRTMWGINIEELKTIFGEKLSAYCLENVAKHIENGDVIEKNNHLVISSKGIFISDGIMSDLMYID